MHRLSPVTPIYPGCYQLPRITKSLYDQLQKDHPKFCQYVSESVFAYYCAVVVYFRLLRLQHIKAKTKTPLTKDELDLHDNIMKSKLMVPALLRDYVVSLGDVTFFNSHYRERYEFTMLPIKYFTAQDKSTGWFGPINNETFIYYLMYPCLTVYTKRIVQDLLYTAGTGNEVWNLPGDIAPQEPNAGNPTENLLGYAKAKKLTQDQVDFLSEGGVTADKIFNSNGTFPLALRLLSEVSRELVKLENVELNTSICSFRMGSVAQLPMHYTVCLKENRKEDGYREIDGPFVQMSKYKHPPQLHTAALKFQFQIRFNVQPGYNSWSIYDFNQFKDVPESWQNTMLNANDNIATGVEFVSHYDAWKDFSTYKFLLNGNWRKFSKAKIPSQQMKNIKEVNKKEEKRGNKKKNINSEKRKLAKEEIRRRKFDRGIKENQTKRHTSTPIDTQLPLPGSVAKLVLK